MSASKAGCGPFKRKVSTSCGPLSHCFTISAGFQVRGGGNFSSGTRTLSWGARCVTRTLCSSGGVGGSAAKVTLLILHRYLLLWPAVWHLCPAYYFEVTCRTSVQPGFWWLCVLFSLHFCYNCGVVARGAMYSRLRHLENLSLKF